MFILELANTRVLCGLIFFKVSIKIVQLKRSLKSLSNSFMHLISHQNIFFPSRLDTGTQAVLRFLAQIHFNGSRFIDPQLKRKNSLIFICQLEGGTYSSIIKLHKTSI